MRISNVLWAIVVLGSVLVGLLLGWVVIAPLVWGATYELRPGDSAVCALPSTTPTGGAPPTPSAVPTPIGAACISIVAPANGSVVSGSVAVRIKDVCAGVWYEDLYVDGAYVASFNAGSVMFSSASEPNGVHTVQVNSHSQNAMAPGVVLGSAAVVLNVQNAPSPTSGASVLPTPPTSAPTPSGGVVGHFGNVGPQSSSGAINSDAYCASQVPTSMFPENMPANAGAVDGWNYNNQIWTTPSYFFNIAGHFGPPDGDPAAAFTSVSGAYAGTTQDIMRWAACKWGIDEDWVYAESNQESSWRQDCAVMHGGSGCNAVGDCNAPDQPQLTAPGDQNLSFDGFQVTDASGNFVGARKYAISSCPDSNGGWASWGIIQSKINFREWMAWPMVAISTAWGEDYRWAKYRACVNGQTGNIAGNADYQAAVSRARSAPNAAVSGAVGPTGLLPGETNLQYLSLGCLALHFSGSFFTGPNDSTAGYASRFINNYLRPRNWPGGRG